MDCDFHINCDRGGRQLVIFAVRFSALGHFKKARCWRVVFKHRQWMMLYGAGVEALTADNYIAFVRIGLADFKLKATTADNYIAFVRIGLADFKLKATTLHLGIHTLD